MTLRKCFKFSIEFILTHSLVLKAVEEFWRFAIEFRAGRNAIAVVVVVECFEAFFQRTPHLCLVKWNFRLILLPPKERRGP